MKYLFQIAFVILTLSTPSCFPVFEKPGVPLSIDSKVIERIKSETKILIFPVWSIVPIVQTDGAEPEKILKQPIFSRGQRANSSYKKMKLPTNFGVTSIAMNIGKQAHFDGLYIFTLSGNIFWLQTFGGETSRFYLVKISTMDSTWLKEFQDKMDKNQAFNSKVSVNSSLWGAFEWGLPYYKLGFDLSKSEIVDIKKFFSEVRLSEQSSWKTIKNDLLQHNN